MTRTQDHPRSINVIFVIYVGYVSADSADAPLHFFVPNSKSDRAVHLYQIFVYIQQPTKDIQFTHQSREELLHKIIRVGFIISLHLLIHKSKHIEGTGNNILVL